jgi:hypothetical protein
LVQQLPGMQFGPVPQQMSAPLAAHVVPTEEHESDTQACVLTSQMVAEP